MNREKGYSGFQQRFPRLELGSKSNWQYLFGSINLLGTLTVVAACGGKILAAPVPLLSSWRYDPNSNQLEVILQQQTTPRYFLLEQPQRIVLDLPNTQVGKATQQTYSGAVRRVRVSQFEQNITRIVLELAPNVILDPAKVQLQRITKGGRGDRWLLHPQPRQNSKLPPATLSSPQPGVVSVPPLTPTSAVTTVPTNTSSHRPPVIDFGQPLPTIPQPTSLTPRSQNNLIPTLAVRENRESSPTTTQNPLVVPNNGSGSPDDLVLGTNATNGGNQARSILLPAGSRLNLRYAGSELILPATSPQPIQLLLTEDLRDRLPDTKSIIIGKVLAPAGTPVTGRFATDTRGSRFIANSIALSDRTIPLVAESEIIDSNHNSSENAVKTTAEPATLLPGAIVQIRLTQHLRKF